MDTKNLLTGIICFIAGALLVSVAATTFDKAEVAPDSISSMVQSLKDKQGDEFDKTFISEMIAHHVGAVEMAKLSEKQAKHDEIKLLSKDIITAQEKEISEMRQWQIQWGYGSTPASHSSH